MAKEVREERRESERVRAERERKMVIQGDTHRDRKRDVTWHAMTESGMEHAEQMTQCCCVLCHAPETTGRGWLS